MPPIISSYGGQPISAPSMREVPLDSNPDAIAFADALARDEFELVILLTGVGTRALVAVVEQARGSRDAFVSALGRTKVLARGPKPVAGLRELALTPWLTAPEPNPWREVLSALDDTQREFSLSGKRVAVQEYGASNPDLLAGLEERGARVTRVPVYVCALFRTATRVVRLLKVPDSMGMRDAVRLGLTTCVVASIGPTTSEEMREPGIAPDMEPTHPKMGLLVREAAGQAPHILRRKR